MLFSFQKYWIGRKVFIKKSSGGFRLVKINKIDFHNRLIKVIWADEHSFKIMEKVVDFEEIIM